jgi:Ca2+-binding RTX toxin-like protein
VGEPGQDSDRFADVFKANADLARGVVDAVLNVWATALDTLNFPNRENPNRYEITVSMDEAGTGFTSTGGGGYGGDGFPTQGTVTLGRGNDVDGDGKGDGAGWFLDPTPNDHVEFTDIINPFAARPKQGSPAFGMTDLYNFVNAELYHALGFLSLPPGGIQSKLQNPLNGRVVPLGTTDLEYNIGTYFVFDGPSVTALLTSNNGGNGGEDTQVPAHSAGPIRPNMNEAIPFQSQFRGQVQLTGGTNAGNASDVGSVRVLVPDNLVLIMKDAYGFGVKLPSTLPNGTFGAQLNQTTGQLMVQGGTGNDQVQIQRQGNDLMVAVNNQNDGPVPAGLDNNGDGNAEAFLTRFAASDVKSIMVDEGEGADSVTLDLSGSDVGIDEISVLLGPGDDSLNVVSTVGVTSTMIDGGEGDDSFTGNLSEVTTVAATPDGAQTGGRPVAATAAAAILDALSINGGIGQDRLVLDDRANRELTNFTLTATQVSGSRIGSKGVNYDSVENLDLLPSLLAGAAYNILSSVPGSTLSLHGTAGDDLETIRPTAAAIVYDASDGHDTISIQDPEPAAGPMGTVTIIGGRGGDRITGGSADDVLVGDHPDRNLLDDGKDFIWGGAGHDTIRGGGGHDWLEGGAGSDRIWGELGNDRIDGNDGDDELDGGAGDDRINGNAGADILRGGDGYDGLEGDDGNDQLFGQDGVDWLQGNAGNDALDGGTSADTLAGNDGDDTLQGGDGDDQLEGGEGLDHLFGNDGEDRLIGNGGNDLLVGGDGGDELQGLTGDDTLLGGNGNDRLVGHDGNDLLVGGDGNDRLRGGAGRDVLIGGLSQDELHGGDGENILIAGSTAHDRNTSALDAILTEWTSTHDFIDRVNNLRNGTGSVPGLNGAIFLTGSAAQATVFDDGVTDALEGHVDRDWLFADVDTRDGDDDAILAGQADVLEPVNAIAQQPRSWESLLGKRKLTRRDVRAFTA